MSKFCNLYVFVKKENPELFEILEDICAVGLFRAKYPVTFINPSKSVTDKLVKLVNEGNVDKAFEQLQKHFIYGKYASLAKGPFVTYNHKMMKTDLAKNTEPNKVFTQWKSDNVAVFNQTNAAMLEEGESAERPKLDKKKGSSQINSRTYITELLQKEKDKMQAFAYAVNGLLVKLEDSDKFDEIKKKLDPNPIVCWYILVKPSASEESEYVSDEVFESWAESFEQNINNKSASMYKAAFESNDYGNDAIEHAKKMRSKLNYTGVKNLIEGIINSYENQAQLIEDEIRFRFSDYGQDELENYFSELDNLTWTIDDTIMFKSNNTMLAPLLSKTIVCFVESNCFHYSMYDEKVHSKFNEFVKEGAGSGKKIIKILGSGGRKLLSTLKSDSELEKFVSGLSKKQVTMLKKALSAN